MTEEERKEIENAPDPSSEEETKGESVENGVIETGEKSAETGKISDDSTGAGTGEETEEESTRESGEKEVEGEEEEESVEIVEEEFRPKIKPVLTSEIREKLEMKKARKLPKFRRQEWFRYRRLGEKWRRPKGLHSKMRRHMKYRPPVVRVGYRTPVEVRGLHPSGFREVLIYNPSQLEGINPEREAARIARTVGTRKRIEIIEKADSLNIRVLNRRGF